MTAERLVIALAQLAAWPGDVQGQRARLSAARREAAGADLIVAPELYLSGFAPLDLLRRPAFVEACRAACEDLARETGQGGPALLVGLPWAEGGALYNAVALIDGGRIEAVRFKTRLGTEEAARFRAGPDPGPIGFRGARLGLLIGEDAEAPDAAECLVETGGEILLGLHCSPYGRDRIERRQNLAVARVVESGLPMAFLNGIGPVDEAVADGGSFVLNDDRGLAVQLPGFREAVVRTTWLREGAGWACERGERAKLEEGDEADDAACGLALKAFFARSGAEAVYVAGDGAGAALCAALAADALGRERVLDGPAEGALRLSALDRTGLFSGEGGLDGDYAPLIDLYRADVLRLAARRGLASGPERDAAGDEILRALLDEGRRVADLVASGEDPARVAAIEAGLARGEARRRRAPPGARLSPPVRLPWLQGFRDLGAPAQAPDAALAPKGARGGAERFEE